MRLIQNSVDSTYMIVRAAVVLHNFLRQINSAVYCPGEFFDLYDSTGKLKKGDWRRIVSKGGRSCLLNNFPNAKDPAQLKQLWGLDK